MAKDLFHDAVKRALEKENWIITDDPLVIPAGVYVTYGLTSEQSVC